VSIPAGPHPWKTVVDGSTPIWDALISGWLATHHQHYPGEAPVGRQPKVKRVLTPLMDQAAKDAKVASQPAR
jgi:hypothetical protein